MLMLIDGNSLLFRAYYGVRATMTRSDGAPLNAVYGFMNMLMPILSKTNDEDKIVCVFDASRTTFRSEIYPEYKANRQSTPEDLVKQIEIVRGAVRSLGIPVLCVPNVEADDVIATLAIENQNNDEIKIVTSDKDLMQLVNDKVHLYDGANDRIIRFDEVIEKFNVRPNQVVDTQSLMGDSSDNVPGVPGIGPKKAAELINQFETLDNIYININDVKNDKLRQLLIDNEDKARISKELVKLKTDVDLGGLEIKPWALHLDTALEYAKTQIESKSLIEKIQKLADKKKTVNTIADTVVPTEFMACEIPTAHAPDKTDLINAKYKTITDEKQLDEFIKSIGDILAIDTETTGLDTMADKIVGISLAANDNQGVYIPLRHKTAATDLFDMDATAPNQMDINFVRTKLWPILTNPKITKVGHNLKYDFHIMENENWDTTQIRPIDDTMLMSYAIYGSKHLHNLDDLAKLYLNHENISYSSLFPAKSRDKNFDTLDIETATPYAAEDAVVCLALYQKFKSDFQENENLENIYNKCDLPLMPVLLKMERNGISLDIARLNDLSVLFHKKMNEVEQEIWKLSGNEFNIASPKQLATVLFDELKLPENKKRSTDADTLNDLSKLHPIVPLILEYRSLAKLSGTYTDSLTDKIGNDGRIHTNYLQTSTNTGRLSSRDPNLQNIPIKTDMGTEIRKCFVAGPGKKLIVIDYSQIQLRLLADVANVRMFVDTFDKNQDIHEQTARRIFNIPANDPVAKDLRRAAKTINFSIIYGISAFGLSNLLNTSSTEAQKIINSYLDEIPEIKKYMDDTKQFAMENGFVLTPWGRKIDLGDVQNPKLRSYAMRVAVNAPIQGFEADIMRLVLIKLDEFLRDTPYAKMLLQVHDEVVFECDEEYALDTAERIKNIMESIVSLSIPLKADYSIDKSWDK